MGRTVPWSYDTFDGFVAALVRWALPDRGTPILDVGPGAGKYAKLLSDYSCVDAVEAFEPYVERFDLRRLYRHICVANVANLVRELRPRQYELAILGDVLEHLSVAEAREVIGRLLELQTRLLVIVPFRLEQAAACGNVHEIHRQPDLSVEVMRIRYPQLSLLVADERSGAFVGGPSCTALAGPLQ